MRPHGCRNGGAQIRSIPRADRLTELGAGQGPLVWGADEQKEARTLLPQDRSLTDPGVGSWETIHRTFPLATPPHRPGAPLRDAGAAKVAPKSRKTPDRTRPSREEELPLHRRSRATSQLCTPDSRVQTPSSGALRPEAPGDRRELPEPRAPPRRPPALALPLPGGDLGERPASPAASPDSGAPPAAESPARQRLGWARPAPLPSEDPFPPGQLPAPLPAHCFWAARLRALWAGPPPATPGHARPRPAPPGPAHPGPAPPPPPLRSVLSQFRRTYDYPSSTPPDTSRPSPSPEPSLPTSLCPVRYFRSRPPASHLVGR